MWFLVFKQRCTPRGDFITHLSKKRYMSHILNRLHLVRWRIRKFGVDWERMPWCNQVINFTHPIIDKPSGMIAILIMYSHKGIVIDVKLSHVDMFHSLPQLLPIYQTLTFLYSSPYCSHPTIVSCLIIASTKLVCSDFISTMSKFMCVVNHTTTFFDPHQL